jgi:hypothetical protein
MKFLKQKNLSKFSIKDQTLFANEFGRIVMDGHGGLMLPKGTTAQRPKVSGVRVPSGNDGYIRYNTSINPVTGSIYGIEAYINGVWEVIRAPGATAITKQTLGPGDYSNLIFGPLSAVPEQDDAILVLVENIMQISVTNFSVLYNYQGSGQAYLQFTEAPPLGKYITVYFGFAN